MSFDRQLDILVAVLWAFVAFVVVVLNADAPLGFAVGIAVAVFLVGLIWGHEILTWLAGG